METTLATSASITSGSEEITNLISQLPKQLWFEEYDLYHWHGYWSLAAHLEGMLAAQLHFKALDDDIIIASSPKAGTTWLKSLVPTIMNGPRDADDVDDSLTKKSPHALVQTLEVHTFYRGQASDDQSLMSSPRIFHTHMPYNSLPDSIKKSTCKVVYVARNPKDAFVSMWHFFNSMRKPDKDPYPMDKAFESFCDGVQFWGPYFDHVLEYWNASLISPEKILFLKYEEMKRNPKEEVKKLASFLGRPLLGDEEVDNVVKRCSFERLKSLEVNKHGNTQGGIPHKSFFRKGTVGDWKNIFTAEMQERVDQIVRSKYEGSGLNLEV